MNLTPSTTEPGKPTARRYGGASAAERQAQRLERLLEAGFDVFGRMGYREATMRMICSQARLTDRYFYEHFATVDEVFSAVHQKASSEAARAVVMSVATVVNAEDPQAMVRAGLKAFYEFIKEDPRRAQILLMDAVTSGLTSPLNINARISRYVDVMRLRLKMRFPHLPFQPDTELILGGFVGLIIHSASVWVQRNFDTPIDTLVDHTSFSWLGLHQWLAAQEAAAVAVAPAATATSAAP
jgi:AcrR family transcriptional regulator